MPMTRKSSKNLYGIFNSVLRKLKDKYLDIAFELEEKYLYLLVMHELSKVLDSYLKLETRTMQLHVKNTMIMTSTLLLKYSDIYKNELVKENALLALETGFNEANMSLLDTLTELYSYSYQLLDIEDSNYIWFKSFGKLLRQVYKDDLESLEV